MRSRRRLFAPEVVQTSAMDCGPAALKCLLEGYGVNVSYGRLREACQTDVDGTSIDTMETVANQLGLEVEQIMAPPDHLLLPGAELLPAIVVVRLPSGITHFVVAWRRQGRFVQVMDPATGRRWATCRRFLEELYIHRAHVAAEGWREWAGSEEFLHALRRRLGRAGVSRGAANRAIDRALEDLSWRGMAAVDAAARMLDSLVRSGGLRRGPEAERVLDRFLDDPASLPAHYWSVRPESEEEGLVFGGAVLVRVRGLRAPDRIGQQPEPLSPELKSALEEPPSRPGRELLRLLLADGWLAPAALFSALALAAGAILFEAVLFRGLLDRHASLAAVILFSTILLLLELPIAAGVLRFGRRLEARLRIAFLEKIPRLGDRYFQSRLTSDMAERSHTTHRIRHLPDLGAQLTRAIFELVFTTAGIAWLDPASAPIALLAAGIAVSLPVGVQPVLIERDLRLRSHTAALTRFYLDALLGLVAIRAHSAERAVRREHDELLVEWGRAGMGLQRIVVAAEGLQFFLGFGLAGWLLLNHVGRGGEAGGLLLLVYWALNIPVLGQEVALIARQYPAYRNTTLRLLEPLGAREDEETRGRAAAVARGCAGAGDLGAAISMRGVRVQIAGRAVLENVDVDIAAGSHVAIVGPSGAGKSSLVGILLGWHRPASGQVLVDGEPLDAGRLEQLRLETAWVDPAVQLWNRSVLENLRYGAGDDSLPIDRGIAEADLAAVLEKLPDGMETRLGEGGALVSGGEGQRVRLARAMLRPGVRLVVLDEPFRGLDREKRGELLSRSRAAWKNATLLCITHDVGETQSFDRVLVIEGGRVVEDGRPAELAWRAGSRYADLLRAEEAVRHGLWSSAEWRMLRLEQGELTERRAARAS